MGDMGLFGQVVVSIIIIVVYLWLSNRKKWKQHLEQEKRTKEHNERVYKAMLKSTAQMQYSRDCLTRAQIEKYQEQGLLDKNLEIKDWLG